MSDLYRDAAEELFRRYPMETMSHNNCFTEKELEKLASCHDERQLGSFRNRAAEILQKTRSEGKHFPQPPVSNFCNHSFIQDKIKGQDILYCTACLTAYRIVETEAKEIVLTPTLRYVEQVY